MKLALAVPSYGPIDPHIDKALRVAIMTASNHGITWAGDVSTIRVGWVEGRNGALDAALESGADGLFWMDDDILLPPNAIIQLASYGKDFTSGMYFQKFFPHWPLFAMFNGVKFNWFRDFPDESKLFEVDGVGFGCAFTSAKLLKALKDKFEGVLGGLHVLPACRRARDEALGGQRDQVRALAPAPRVRDRGELPGRGQGHGKHRR